MTLRELVERFLPWYDPRSEHRRDQRTEAIAQRSEVARQRADAAIAAYQRADDAHRRASEDLIEEIDHGR